MNQAAEIMYSSKNANDAIERAEAAKAGVTHDWDHSFYTFEDGSVLVVSGSQVNAHADMALPKAGGHA